MPSQTKKNTKADVVMGRIAKDLRWLQSQAGRETKTGKAPRARVLWYALGAHLDDLQILDHLKMASAYMQKHV